MDFLILIKNGCDNLTTTVSPSIDSLGLRMVVALATIMLVWSACKKHSRPRKVALDSAYRNSLASRPDHLRLQLREVLSQLNPRDRVLTKRFR